jgi:hypothetical protein
MTARQSSALLHQKSYPMVRKYQLRSPLERRTWVIVHRSLLPGHCSSKVCETGGLGSCACFAVGCGCAMADGVQGRGAATRRKCHRCSVRGWQPDRTGSAPTPLQRDLVFVRCQPRMLFLFFCSRYWVWRPAAGQGTLLSMGTFPAVQCSTEKTRMGAEGVCETNVTSRSIFLERGASRY